MPTKQNNYLYPEILKEKLRNSSIGHAFLNWLSGFLISEIYELEFIHPVFTHSCKDYEKVLNFSSYYKKIENIKYNKIVKLPNFDFGPKNINKSLNDLKYIINENKNTNTLFKTSGSNQFPETLLNYCKNLPEKISKPYWDVKHSVMLDISNKTSIHIRRGDISRIKNNDRWVDNDFYLNIIKKFDFKNVIIFSEGEEKDFFDFREIGCELFLNGDDVFVFNNLCHSKNLITGASSFSCLAALINKNKIFYKKCSNMFCFDNFGERYEKI